MIARGFKPVGWVGAVAGAALGCYMLSLNVAAERAELASLERKIIATKQDIRTLQTELGTRGRLSQLEHWNAEVLALSAPTAGQYLENEVVLARFDQRPQTIDERAKDVQLASAPAREAQPGPRLAVADFAAAARAAETDPIEEKRSLVRRAALVVEGDKPLAKVKPAAADKPASKEKNVSEAAAAAAPAKPKPKKTAGRIGEDLEQAIGEAAKAEKKSGGTAAR